MITLTNILKDTSQPTEEEKRELSGKEKSSLKNLFYVLLDGRRITRRGKLPHFEVKIANKTWRSYEEAEKVVHQLVNQFYLEGLEKSWEEESEQEELKRNTSAEDEEAVKILLDNPLEWIDELQSGRIVGEEANRRIITLSKSTYIYDEPTSERIMSPESGVGKSWLLTNVLECFPEEDVYVKSRITRTWLDRTKDDLNHKILVIQQMAGYMSGQESIHVILTEHKLVLATVGKDGEAYNIEVKGHISFGFTTTSIFINPQMETRTLLLNVDESQEQTARIQKRQQEEEKQPWLKKERLEKLHKARKVIRWLRDEGIKQVIIPFSDLLTFPVKQTSLRRQRPQIIELIKQTTRVNQLKRYVLEKEEVKYIVAWVEDVEYVLGNFGTVFQTSLQRISENEWNVLKRIEAFTETKCEIVVYEIVEKPTFTAKEASKFFGRTPGTTRRWLNNMESKGFVEIVKQGGGKGKMNEYRVTLPTKDANPFYTVSNSITPDICKKKLKELVKQYRDTVSVYSAYNITLKARKKLFPKEGA